RATATTAPSITPTRWVAVRSSASCSSSSGTCCSTTNTSRRSANPRLHRGEKTGTARSVKSGWVISRKDARAPIRRADQLPEAGEQFAAHAEMLVFEVFGRRGAGEEGLLVAQIGERARVGIEPEHVAVADFRDRPAIGGFGGHVDGGGHLARGPRHAPVRHQRDL